MTATSISLPPLPPGIRLLTDREGDRLRAKYPDLRPLPKVNCITCRGEGSFRWRSLIREEAIVTYECPCKEQWILHRYLLHSNVLLTYQRLGWRDVHAEPGAVEKIMQYLDRAEDYVAAGCGLILYGEQKGTGKTLLATLTLKALLGMGYDGYFTTFSEALDMFTAGWHDKADKQWFYRRVKNAGVLVLDDIGREFKQRRMVKDEGLVDHSTAVAEATFDEVLRHRVASSKPTILTTNLDMARLESAYGSNVMSLLHERSTTYRFTGKDWRDQARMRLDDEIKAHLIRPIVLG